MLGFFALSKKIRLGVTGTPPPQGITCNRDEFACNSKDQCVPRSQVCDGKYDCNDYSDETNSDCRKLIRTGFHFLSFRPTKNFLILSYFTKKRSCINLKTGVRARNGSSAAKTARAFPSRRNVTIKSIVPIPVTNWTVSLTSSNQSRLLISFAINSFVSGGDGLH